MKRFPLWHLAIVAVVCLAAFANSISGEFVWDDEVQIAKNPAIQSLSNLPSAFSRPFWAFATPSEPNRTNFYRPLQTVAYTVAYAMGGLSPEPYHAISIGLHTLASVALYLVCTELGLSPLLALLGAALFGVHPIHTEAVSWMAALPDVICGLFYFAALWTFLRSDAGKWRGWWLGSAALYLLGLFAKEMAITLPLIVLVLTWRPGVAHMTWRERTRLMGPYGLVTAVYLGLRISALGFIASSHTEATASLGDWITLGFRALGEYLWLTLVPYPLIAYRVVPLHLVDRMGATTAATVATFSLTWAAWRSRHRWPEIALYLGAFGITLIPVFYFKGISTALMAERYLYIPSAAIILLAVAFLDRTPHAWRWMAWLVVAAFLGMTITRNQDWSSAESLYTSTLEREPRAAVFHMGLANLLLPRNADTQVLFHLNEAARYFQDPSLAPVAYDAYSLEIATVAVLLRTGQMDQAIPHLEAAAKVNPAGEWVAVYRGAIQMAKYSDDTGAAALLENAVKINPNNEVAHDYLGTAYFNLGRYPEALAEFRKAVALKPNFATAQQHLALMLQQYPQ